ncbi:MAG: deoxyribodipyrimidine photo-lyase/cryptochrome family protein [Planctomycetaceae bacterium]|jgi:deoxyribodipyrimidine photo-lyase|nr:deoxyribodipyrimidine photo-lyase/cryptochrome family protein [Planctomycetaceae bacterium]
MPLSELPSSNDCPISIVWLKRDFRIEDHYPLAVALQSQAVLPVWIIEPQWWKSPDMDRTHFGFAKTSALELREKLRALGGDLIIQIADAVEAFEVLSKRLTIREILSHEETGGMWTYQRDKKVLAWCKSKNIPWREFRQDGVVRRLATRDQWALRWQQWAEAKQASVIQKVSLPVSLQPAESRQRITASDQELNDFEKSLPDVAVTNSGGGLRLQTAGEDRAGELLDSFLDHRGIDYRTSMSSPISAESSCSRLSPYLAWGCINVRQVYQRLGQVRRGPPWSGSLSSFRSRLSWHCHFMQKLEDETDLEFRNLCRAYDGLREEEFSEERFDAWCRGQTGFPMIDACMRYLHKTRWINFRMRAMLVSFASYDLWLHWRRPAEFLARNFLDFEPGIHYPQVQMQSGVTGINTIRIYSPEKQGKDQDPQGMFVREHLPELGRVPLHLLWTPWKMSLDEQVRYGCRLGKDYPCAIVDHQVAVRQAKEKLYAVRGSQEAQQLALQVAKKHASRKRRDPIPTRRRVGKNNPDQPLLPGFEETE